MTTTTTLPAPAHVCADMELRAAIMARVDARLAEIGWTPTPTSGDTTETQH